MQHFIMIIDSCRDTCLPSNQSARLEAQCSKQCVRKENRHGRCKVNAFTL